MLPYEFQGDLVIPSSPIQEVLRFLTARDGVGRALGVAQGATKVNQRCPRVIAKNLTSVDYGDWVCHSTR